MIFCFNHKKRYNKCKKCTNEKVKCVECEKYLSKNLMKKLISVIKENEDRKT